MTEALETKHSGKMKERFTEMQTRLRRQMVMVPKPLVLAGTLPLPTSPAHMLSSVRAPLPAPTPMHLLLAVASVGITWASASWLKQRWIRSTAE
jgi:hypothetical protein